MTGKPIHDWDMPVSQARFLLSELLRRDGLNLTDLERAAIGAGRMALFQFMPGLSSSTRVTEPMVANAKRVCPDAVVAAMGNEPETRIAFMLECGMTTYVTHFNRYRSPPLPSRRRPGGR